MTKSLEESIVSLETAVLNETKDLEKTLEAEEQKILCLNQECDMLQIEIEKIREIITTLDEQTREVYRKFTSSREKCKDLKQLMQCIENHENEIQIKLKNEIQKGRDDNLQYSQALNVYQNKWYNYKEIYEQHPLMPTVFAKKKELKESEELLQEFQSQLKQLQGQSFKIKCDNKRKFGESTVYCNLNNYIVELSKLRMETINNQKHIQTIHREIKELTNAARRKQEILKNNSSNEIKHTEITSQDNNNLFLENSEHKSQFKPSSFQKPKFQFYIPQFSSTPARSIKSITPEYLSAPKQNDTSHSETVRETEQDFSNQMNREDNVKETENLESHVWQNSSSTSSNDCEYEREASSFKSPGFSYSSRFMFTPSQLERSDKNLDFSLSYSSFQTPNFENISQQTEPSFSFMKTKDQTNAPSFLFAQSPSVIDNNPFGASLTLNNSSVFSLFANDDNTANPDESESSNFTFNFNQVTSPVENSFKFNF